MSNKVVRKNNKLWIVGNSWKRISPIYKFEGEMEETKNLLYFTTRIKQKKLLNLFVPTSEIKKELVININTLEILEEEIISPLSHFGSLRIYGDFLYFNEKDSSIYDYNNKLILDNINSIFSLSEDNNILIANRGNTTNPYFCLLYNGCCIEKDFKYYKVYSKNKIIFIKDEILYVYDLENSKYIGNTQISKSQKYQINIFYDVIHLEYINVDIQKSELIKLYEPQKVFKFYGNTYPALYNFTKTGKAYLHIILNNTNKTKIFNCQKWNLLDESEVIKVEILKSKKCEYLVLYTTEAIKVYSENLEFIFSIKCTSIKLSKNKNYFILKNMDLKGIATLNGKILIEIVATEIRETFNCFYYKDVHSNETKTIQKNPKDFLNNKFVEKKSN